MTWNNAFRNDSSVSIGLLNINPIVVMAVRMNTEEAYHLSSASLKNRLIFPFMNRRNNKVKFTPDRNMKIATIYSI